MATLSKQVREWNINDFMQFIKSIGIRDDYKKIKQTMTNKSLSVSDLIDADVEDFVDAFGIHIMIARKIRKNLQMRLANELNECIPKYKENNDKTFCVNISSGGARVIKLRRPFTANSYVSDVAQAYKDEECVYQNEAITLIANGSILQDNKTLGYYNIINENNLITVPYKTQGGGYDIKIDEKEDVQQHFTISSNVHLTLDNQMKSKALRDESGFNIIPMNIYDAPKPVISFALDLSYDSWTIEMEDDFLAKLAKELIVNKHELVVLCKSRGSVKLSVLVNAIKTQYHNIRITCAYIEKKAKTLDDSSTLKKFCIKSTQIKEWFTKKLKDNTENIKKSVGYVDKSFGGLNKSEQWILNQSKVLKSKLDDTLKKLNGQYIVSAICILDNDEALNKFIQHPCLHQSKLLFHGTYLDALGSIYKTGLNHGGGAVYGHGSYLTSSPLHSINYMICYKSGKSKTSEYTLIAAYVNCGSIKQIYDTSYVGKKIENKYDSHYIASVASVADKKHLGYPLKLIKQRYNTDYRGHTANEYAIKDKSRILPRFYITLKKVKKDCFAYFTGLVVSDEYLESNISAAYIVDPYSECVGEGSYAKNSKAFPNAVKTTFDGIAIDEGTRVIIWEKENFQGRIWLDKTGPAIINNVNWKSDQRYNGTMTKTFKDADLQKLYPQNKRFWSVSNMHDWSKGSLKVMSV
eukprot:291061_1